MSRNNLNLKLVLRKYLRISNFIFAFISSFVVSIIAIVLVLIFNKHWYDAISVIAIIYICLGILIIVFDIAQFKTWAKLKNLFAVRKDNNEPFTKFEKTQMKILRISDEETEAKYDKEKRKIMFRFIASFMFVLGIILLCISLPFIF